MEVGLIRPVPGRGAETLEWGIALMAWTLATVAAASVRERITWYTREADHVAEIAEYAGLALSVIAGPVVAWVCSTARSVAEGTPHHEACLQFNGRCGIYGCEPDREPRAVAAAQAPEKEKDGQATPGYAAGTDS